MADVQLEAGRMIRTSSFFEVLAPMSTCNEPDAIEIGGAV